MIERSHRTDYGFHFIYGTADQGKEILAHSPSVILESRGLPGSKDTLRQRSSMKDLHVSATIERGVAEPIPWVAGAG